MKPDIIHHRENEPFVNIKKGIKTMEIRLNDEKRQEIKLGNIIKTINQDNDSEVLYVKVIGLARFGSFRDLFKAYGDKIKDYEKEILKRVYSKEQEEKYGVLVIHFELLNQKP